MLLNELVKSGPLAKVWLSAHQEKKLSKAQALGVDVGESVEAILTQDDALPLRSSGPLMLGVVRIYSRKVGYLYDDCREARERISLAFRPGMVDLPEDQVRASKAAITIADGRNEFDFFDWSWTAPLPALPTAPTGTAAGTTSAQAAITLPRSKEYGAYNFGMPRAPSIYGGSTRVSDSASRHGSQDLEGSYLDSNDFSGIDLGLNFEGDISLEVGRDVHTPISREGSIFAAGAGRKSRESPFGSAPSIQGDLGAGGFEPLDLGLDLENLDQPVPELDDRSRRETSGLSTPPPLSPQHQNITPRTAARLAQTPTTATAKPKRLRLVQADDELEIPDDPNRNNSDILGEERYIPSDPEVVRLREIAADPAAYFLPTLRVGGEAMIFAGPEGLAPELAELFTFPSNVLRRGRGVEEAEADAGRGAKRPRLEGAAEEEEEDVETGRRVAGRASEGPAAFDLAPETGLGFGDDSFAFQADEPYLDEPLLTPRATRVRQATWEPSIAPSRAESIAREIQFGEEKGEYTLAMFDTRAAGARESQSLLSTPSKSASAAESQHTTASGFSKNTSMAMGLLRKELDAIEEGERVLSFEKTAKDSSKRAASSFFFELLVLGTRDCVKLDQPEHYGDIQVRGKDKLWPEGVAA